MVGHLPGMHYTLGSIHSIAKRKEGKQRKEKNNKEEERMDNLLEIAILADLERSSLTLFPNKLFWGKKPP